MWAFSMPLVKEFTDTIKQAVVRLHHVRHISPQRAIWEAGPAESHSMSLVENGGGWARKAFAFFPDFLIASCAGALLL
jgi:hypothetical protein